MKEFLIIVIFLLNQPLWASPLWSGAESGMSVSQVLKKFDDATVTGKPSVLATGAADKVCIPSYKYLGHEFAVHFYFTDGGLQQVTLEIKNPSQRQELKKLVELIDKDLSKTFGEPERSNSDNSAMRTIRLAWSSPTHRVSVIGVNYGPTEEISNGGFLSINYQHPETKEPNKAAQTDGDKPSN